MSVPSLKQPFKDDGNLKWYVCWTEGRRSRRTSTGTSNLEQAKIFLSQWLVMEKTAAAPDEATIGHLWSLYYDKHVRREVVSKDTADYSWKNLEAFFSSMRVSELTSDVVEDYVDDRTSGTIGRTSAPATVRRELSALVACLNWCAHPKRKIIAQGSVPQLELPPDSEPRDRWLKVPEIQALLTAARKARRGCRLSRVERFLWLALETGARKTAIAELTWDRVDFETGVIHYDVPGRKLTKKRRSAPPISKALLPILQRAYAERINEYVLDNQANIWRSVKLVATAAGVNGVSPHVLRHTAATHMARRGVPLWKISKILGNTLAMVEKTYAKHAPDDLREAVDQISGGVLEAAE